MMYSPDQKEFIRELCENREGTWDETFDRVKKEVKKRFKLTLELKDGESLRRLYSKIREAKQKIQELNDKIPGKEKYTVNGEVVDIPTKHGVFQFTLDEIDEYFVNYSKHGENLSGEEMVQKYELKPEAWQAIKGAFRLYKQSNVISPIRAETENEEKLGERIEYATARHIDTIKGRMIVTHDKKFKEEAKKAFKTLGNIEYFLDNLKEFLEGYQPRKIDFDLTPPENNDIKHFFVSDIHLGKMGSDKVLERIERLTADIINSPESIIYLTFGGDLAETLAQDGMHPGQITQGMDAEWGFGFDLMMNTVTVFEEMLIQIAKAGKEIHFTGICGNHGRMTGKNEDDKQRTGELAIYEMIRRGISQLDIDFKYVRDVISTIDYGSVRFIIAHGDGNFDKQSPERIIVSHGSTDKYNIIMSGDKHNMSFKEGCKYTLIKTPALAGKGRYDTDMNLHSESGYLTFKENDFGTIDIEVKRLQK